MAPMIRRMRSPVANAFRIRIPVEPSTFPLQVRALTTPDGRDLVVRDPVRTDGIFESTLRDTREFQQSPYPVRAPQRIAFPTPARVNQFASEVESGNVRSGCSDWDLSAERPLETPCLSAHKFGVEMHHRKGRLPCRQFPRLPPAYRYRCQRPATAETSNIRRRAGDQFRRAPSGNCLPPKRPNEPRQHA